MKRLLIGATALLLLTGCASTPAAAPEPTSSPTATAPAGPAETYATVEALRVAFVAAGGECGAWVQSDHVTRAAQSGECSDSTVLSIYSSETDKSTTVSNLKSMSPNVHLLVGGNWVINVHSPESFVDELGGTVVTS